MSEEITFNLRRICNITYGLLQDQYWFFGVRVTKGEEGIIPGSNLWMRNRIEERLRKRKYKQENTNQ